MAKPIVFSGHALDQMSDRGAQRDEVERAIKDGEEIPAKRGRRAFRKNFPYNSDWKGHYYEMKQIIPVVADEPERWIVVTVYVFYFGGKA